MLVLAVTAVYHNSFAGAFVYDDIRSIVDNRTIRQLWPLGAVLSPPGNGETVSGRPLLNLTFALNYAMSGLKVGSYHATNLLIHVSAALLLFGILRRSLRLPTLRDRFGGAGTPLALAIALLWAVHPLQTESVVYISQRAESLAGFFYLLTLYGVIRGAESGNSPLWYATAVFACLLGMATKEVMVTAPLVALLYDRTFLAGSFAEALRRRWGLYAGLAATWLLLAYLVVSTNLVHRQPQMGAPDAWSYARSQPGVILHYLRLSLWPCPLQFDYAWPWLKGLWTVLPGAVVLAVLLAVTVLGLVRRKAYGLLGATFWLVLAPTSSILPLGQLACLHRMYLPLAVGVVLAGAGGYTLWDRWLLPQTASRQGHAPAARWAVPLAVCSIVGLALGYATNVRNRVYQSSLAIWQDELRKNPNRVNVHNNLGFLLAGMGKTDEAIAHYQAALRLEPTSAFAHNNMALALVSRGNIPEAIGHYQEALRTKPDSAEVHSNLGAALASAGQLPEAVRHYQAALQVKPDFVEAQCNLARALFDLGRNEEAIEGYGEALQLRPDFAEAHCDLGRALAKTSQTEQAIAHYRQALDLRPGSIDAHASLGAALAKVGKTQEAVEHYRQALRLGANVLAMSELAWLLATHEPSEGGDAGQAVQLAERARELLGPENPQGLDTLAAAYAAAGRFPEAVAVAEKAVPLAESAHQAQLAKAIGGRLELYRAGRPYREAAVGDRLPRSTRPTAP